MHQLTKLYVKAFGLRKGLTRGQTMAEYALILAAVAIVVFVTYQLMGQDINQLTTWRVDYYLTST